MRHANTKTIALLLTGFPEMDAAARAILRQADESLLKDSDFKKPVESIKHRIANGTAEKRPKVESVARILERVAPNCIDDWFLEVQRDSGLTIVPLRREQRCGHLPQLFPDLVARLRAELPFLAPRDRDHQWRWTTGYHVVGLAIPPQ
jgi:hypothetical protein